MAGLKTPGPLRFSHDRERSEGSAHVPRSWPLLVNALASSGTIERVLSDNGSAYKSHAWHHACAELGISPKKTRPYRPQTNGEDQGALFRSA